MTAVIHIAGYKVTIGPFIRQRCSWCGAVLADHELGRVAVPVGQPWRPPTWEPGSLVAIDGIATYGVPHEDGQPLPDGACGNLDPAVTI